MLKHISPDILPHGGKMVETPGGSLEVRSMRAYLYLLPPLVIFLAFMLYPMIMVLRTSFYQKYVYITSSGSGFGLASFRFVLSDPTFWIAVKNTAILIGVGLPITLILSLGAALLINSIKRLQGLFQTVYFLPYVTSTIAVGSAFWCLFNSDYGYINWFLSLFGIAPIEWLTDPNKVIWTLTIFSVWSGLAFKTVLFLAGLQKIDKQVYSAAKMDGAGPMKILFRVTLPLLSPTIWMVVIVSVIYVARIFNEVYALFVSYQTATAGAGNCAITIAYYIYYMFFVRNQVNYAAAAAVLFLIVIMALTVIQRAISKRFVHYV